MEFKPYNPAEIEPKWQKHWDDNQTFAATNDYSKPKFYGLIEFPYPSGNGLHVGHPRSNTAMDIISRKRRMEGHNVLFPIGWDAFGLPTENFAIKNNIHPAIVTKQNVDHFRAQLKRLGFSFDYSREVDTTDPDYYKWTQWIFLKLFEHGMVFRDKTLVNYCPSCKVVLSNEDSQGGECDICHSAIVQKSKTVWYLRITEYADKLFKERGISLLDASIEAARLRLRPILMTAFSFILGVVPLVFASGVYSTARNILGVALVGGMLLATLLGILIYPALYYLVGRLARFEERRAAQNNAQGS